MSGNNRELVRIAFLERFFSIFGLKKEIVLKDETSYESEYSKTIALYMEQMVILAVVQ